MHSHVVRSWRVSLAVGPQPLPRESPPWPTVLRMRKQKKRASRKLQAGSTMQTRRAGRGKSRQRTPIESSPAWTPAARLEDRPQTL